MADKIILRIFDKNCWLQFEKPEKVLQATQLNEVLPLLHELQDWVDNKHYYAAGLLSYEAGGAFEQSLASHINNNFPLLYFGLYKKPQRLTSLPLAKANPLKNLRWQSDTTQTEFTENINKIQTQIKEGNTYQVNYTYRLHTEGILDAWQTFLQLNQNHIFKYAAYADIGDYQIICNSPEELFTLNQQQLRTSPMKGTIKRGLTAEEDLMQQQILQSSIKDRAENLMILDMARNDLGRIANIGSVHTEQIFQVQQHPTVWQMVSQVIAKTDKSLLEILQALFPAASITGAPKVSTSKIINRLEKSARDIYTGSIGYYAPNRQAQFNVAIRTLLCDTKNKLTTYGIGGGIVKDSKALTEYQESQDKALILKQNQPVFQLFATTRVAQKQAFLLSEHLDRLQKSAHYFDFEYSAKNVQRQLENYLNSHTAEIEKRPITRLKIILHRCGKTEFKLSDYPKKTHHKIILAKTATHSNNLYLYHKTTIREQYDKHITYQPDNVDDIILFNQDGYITEGCISNVIIKHDGKLITSPQNYGLLAGIYRQHLLQKNEISEYPITLKMFQSTSEIFLCNSLRKMWQVSQ